ncbi:MAG: YebC/PmpR family DNA-binding transcriptional regulator [Deltaproteobacteria bacterium]|nr:YebC/PmpR family DNA-binding transcriptional regulator [Deltaproteobacteria bacterium]
MGAQWKHKGRTENAAAKGRVFSKLVKEIMVAAKAGPDPEMNPKLRLCVDAAKKASMPRDTLERAIKKGAGLLDEVVNYELVTYEGFAPHQVPVIVECLTENRTRTASNIRIAFRKGQLAATGAVSWDFTRLGAIEASPPAGADAETAAIEAGAQDLEAAEEGATRFFTEPTDLDTVSKALATAGWKVSSAALIWRAKNPVSVDDAKRADVEAFLEELDADDDVQTLFVGLA